MDAIFALVQHEEVDAKAIFTKWSEVVAKYGAEFATAEDSDGLTLLDKCVLLGHASLFSEVLHSVSWSKEHLNGALRVASVKGDLLTVKMLQERGALAMSDGGIELVKTITVAGKMRPIRTVLFKVSAKYLPKEFTNPRLPAFRYLAYDAQNTNCFNYAIAADKVTILEHFLTCDSIIEQCCLRSLFQICCKCGSLKCATMLLQRNLDISGLGNNTNAQLCLKSNVQMFHDIFLTNETVDRKAIQDMDPNALHDYVSSFTIHFTLLSKERYSLLPTVLSYLLQSGRDVNAKKIGAKGLSYTCVGLMVSYLGEIFSHLDETMALADGGAELFRVVNDTLVECFQVCLSMGYSVTSLEIITATAPESDFFMALLVKQLYEIQSYFEVRCYSTPVINQCALTEAMSCLARICQLAVTSHPETLIDSGVMETLADHYYPPHVDYFDCYRNYFFRLLHILLPHTQHADVLEGLRILIAARYIHHLEAREEENVFYRDVVWTLLNHGSDFDMSCFDTGPFSWCLQNRTMGPTEAWRAFDSAQDVMEPFLRWGVLCGRKGDAFLQQQHQQLVKQVQRSVQKVPDPAMTAVCQRYINTVIAPHASDLIYENLYRELKRCTDVRVQALLPLFQRPRTLLSLSARVIRSCINVNVEVHSDLLDIPNRLKQLI